MAGAFGQRIDRADGNVNFRAGVGVGFRETSLFNHGHGSAFGERRFSSRACPRVFAKCRFWSRERDGLFGNTVLWHDEEHALLKRLFSGRVGTPFRKKSITGQNWGELSGN